MGSDYFTASGSRTQGLRLTCSSKIMTQRAVSSKSLHKWKCCVLQHNASYAALGIPPPSVFPSTRRRGRKTSDGVLPAHASLTTIFGTHCLVKMS